jgi:hypothetical protein
MAIGHHQRYEPYYDDPASSPAAFVAALALLLLMSLIVVLLWAPWSGAGDTSSSTTPQSQLPQIQPVQPEGGGIQLVPNAPQNPGSTSGR